MRSNFSEILPFKSYKIPTKETHRNFLMKEGLELLVDKKFSIQRLGQVRGLFVFACYTGLCRKTNLTSCFSYSDLH